LAPPSPRRSHAYDSQRTGRPPGQGTSWPLRRSSIHSDWPPVTEGVQSRIISGPASPPWGLLHSYKGSRYENRHLVPFYWISKSIKPLSDPRRNSQLHQPLYILAAPQLDGTISERTLRPTISLGWNFIQGSGQKNRHLLPRYRISRAKHPLPSPEVIPTQPAS